MDTALLQSTESCCLTSPPPLSSSVTALSLCLWPLELTWEVPTLFYILLFLCVCVFFVPKAWPGSALQGRWKQKFKPPAACARRRRIPASSVFISRWRLSSTSVKFYPPREDNTTSARHHDSEILCHLRHRDRVRSPPDCGNRPGRGSSLPNNDPQPVKKGKLHPKPLWFQPLPSPVTPKGV